MAQKKDGKSYEMLVEKIFEKLRKNSPFSSVERNVKIPTVHGQRQIDILLKTRSFDMEIRTIVECKDHERKVDVEHLDAIVSKMKDVKANKAIIVSSKGFTSGAKSKASLDLPARPSSDSHPSSKFALPLLTQSSLPNMSQA